MMTLLVKSEDTRYDIVTDLRFISNIHTEMNNLTLVQASLMYLDEDGGSDYCTLLEAYSKYEDYDEYSLKEVTDYHNYDYELVLISRYTYIDDIYSIPHKYDE